MARRGNEWTGAYFTVDTQIGGAVLINWPISYLGMLEYLQPRRPLRRESQIIMHFKVGALF